MSIQQANGELVYSKERAGRQQQVRLVLTYLQHLIGFVENREFNAANTQRLTLDQYQG